MKKRITVTATLLAATTLIGAHSDAYAHNLDVEEQNIDRTGEYNEYGQEIVESRAKPWRDRDGDSSFNNPHQLKFPVSDSQAIFGWLDSGDVDVYEASTSLPGPSYEPDFVVAAPLPAACQTTKNQYPAIALVAPFGTAPVQDPGIFELPFDVPFGHGVLPVYNTPSKPRVIFELPPEDTELPLGLSWFLPNGCYIAEFPYSGFPNCFVSDTLTAPVFAPNTTYYLAVWNPSGDAMDYTLNVGTGEENFQHNEALEDLVRDNNHLHRPCTDPVFEPIE